jgi:hypothetical protein
MKQKGKKKIKKDFSHATLHKIKFKMQWNMQPLTMAGHISFQESLKHQRATSLWGDSWRKADGGPLDCLKAVLTHMECWFADLTSAQWLQFFNDSEGENLIWSIFPDCKQAVLGNALLS